MDKLEELREWIGELNWEGVGDVLSDVVDKIDELNKPLVVPKGLGMWLSDQCLGEEGSFFTVIGELEDMWVESDFEDFITENKKELIEVILGDREYEVEKEKLYYVPLRINRGGSPIYLIKHRNEVGVDWSPTEFMFSDEEKCAYQFTEREIKEFNKNYWPFAVEVADTSGE